ncbi:radical SAM protein [Planctomycetota bacterium]
MVGVISKPDTQQKLQILSTDAQYDLACACSTGKDESRTRSPKGHWIYPVTLPNGGTSVLFKTLMSNACSSDCKYCPLRETQDIRRCSLTPEETVKSFLSYHQRQEVFGLFLSSAVIGSPDRTMERLNTTARLLRRRHGFRGYIHLKVIPGASPAAIEEAVSLSSAVSLNIETPGADLMKRLSKKKDYLRDIVEPIKQISALTSRGNRYERVKQSTQFIVGAAGESDQQIVRYAGRLYDRLGMHRIYFSAYQQGLGDGALEPIAADPQGEAAFIREHRLYQVDFLLRQYGFSSDEMVFDNGGHLSLNQDPKETWALAHPEYFPVAVNRASRKDLLRVPGLGPVTVRRALKRRREHRLTKISDLGKVGALLRKAEKYIVF